MHFAIDQEPSPSVAKVAIPEKPAEDPQAAQEAKLASDMLFASTPVRLTGETKNHDRVEVILKDVYRRVIGFMSATRFRTGPVDLRAGNTRRVHPSIPREFQFAVRALEGQLVGDGIRLTSQGQAPVKVLNAGSARKRRSHRVTLPGDWSRLNGRPGRTAPPF